MADCLKVQWRVDKGLYIILEINFNKVLRILVGCVCVCVWLIHI